MGKSVKWRHAKDQVVSSQKPEAIPVIIDGAAATAEEQRIINEQAGRVRSSLSSASHMQVNILEAPGRSARRFQVAIIRDGEQLNVSDFVSPTRSLVVALNAARDKAIAAAASKNGSYVKPVRIKKDKVAGRRMTHRNGQQAAL